MKVKFSTHEREMHPVIQCTGYRAESLTLDHEDLVILATLNPRDLYATVQQLAMRVLPEAKYDPRIAEASRRSREKDWS